MVKIVLACNKKPLAAFIERELDGLDCRSAVDAAQLMALTVEFKPDVVLLDSEFLILSEIFEVLEKLRDSSLQIPIVGIFEPFGETQDEVRQGFALENVLSLPFSGDDLREKLGQASGLEIKKRASPQEKKKEEEMDNPQLLTVETVELTEIVEEGLPLDELPEISEDKTLEVPLEADSGKTDSADMEPESESAVELEFDGFGDTLEDLESAFDESADAGFDAVVEDPAELTLGAESGIESEVGENSSELVAGDIDALLADDDFTEIEIPERPENQDPVLAELKSAGLTPEDEVVVASKSETASLAAQDLEEDGFGEEALGGIDNFLDEILVEEDVVVQSPEPPSTSESLESAEKPVEADESRETLTTESHDADIELPEDYLLDEEIPTVGIEPAARPPATSPTLSPEPEVYTEPISPDFSRQIEDMTQEWSKQLLQTTYASMDKMIKAIGDLAPTIVAQVAREVIPPLAEKVIKAEIARLEEKLEIEEERESDE